MVRLIAGIMLIVMLNVILCGCRSAGQVKSPATSLERGSGEIFISLFEDSWDEPRLPAPTSRFSSRRELPRPKIKRKLPPPPVTIIELHDSAGRTLGKRVMPVYFGDVFVDALKYELTSAGYSVRIVKKLPDGVGSGINIRHLSADITQAYDSFGSSGTCAMRVSFSTWKNGVNVHSLDYDYKVSNSSAIVEDQIYLMLIRSATQNILSKALPELIESVTVRR